jgi:hypothetical protein
VLQSIFESCLSELQFGLFFIIIFYVFEVKKNTTTERRPIRGSGGRKTELLPGGTWPCTSLMFGLLSRMHDSTVSVQAY